MQIFVAFLEKLNFKYTFFTGKEEEARVHQHMHAVAQRQVCKLNNYSKSVFMKIIRLQLNESFAWLKQGQARPRVVGHFQIFQKKAIEQNLNFIDQPKKITLQKGLECQT